MATRFGATPAHAYNNRVKLLLGFLLGLVALLALAFFVISQNAPPPAPVAPVAPVAAVPQVDPGTEVLVAQSRIEEGTILESFMFTTMRMEESKIPLGAIRQKDLQAAVLGKFAARLISPNLPLLADDISATPPLSQIPIPPGYRAVSVTVGDEQASGGFVQPNSRVDVLWRYVESGKTKVATIVRFVKVLAVNGMTSVEAAAQPKPGPKGVTLLVLEVDAKKIELARNLGNISLMLVGDKEEGASGAGNDVVDVTDLTGGKGKDVEQQVAVKRLGTTIMKDPKTGKTITYYLNEDKVWQIDPTSGQ